MMTDEQGNTSGNAAGESSDKELIDKIRKDNDELNATSGSITGDENMGMSAAAAVPGTPPEVKARTNEPVAKDPSATKNQLGDNPPGSETTAFEAGNFGDMDKDQVKYPTENFADNFRENIDKTKAETELDKKLKED